MFLDIANKRKSVRKYLEKPVEREKILSCLAAAQLAPSASNVQPWKYVVVDEPELKDKVCDAAFSGIYFMNRFARQAPIIVVVLAEPDLVSNKLGALVIGIQYCLLDIGASIEHFLLQAAELGLGTCWLGWFSERRIQNALKIPRKTKIVSLICVGYPAEEEKPRHRKDLGSIVSFNAYKS